MKSEKILAQHFIEKNPFIKILTRFLMKKIGILFISVLCIGCNNNIKEESTHHFKTMDSLVADLDFFKLKEEFQNHKNELSTRDSLYFEAILANAFNNPKKSNKAIDAFFKTQKKGASDSLEEKMWNTKLINHIYRAEYKEALKINENLQHHYAHFLDSTKMEDLKNTHKIWNALKDTPRQKITIVTDVTLPILKDKAGLSSIATTIGSTTTGFVFDTGANFSVIQRSVAEKLGMELLSAQFDVDAATGLNVRSDLAIADTLHLGEITITNVVFLVFDDKDLSFPSIDYEIKGIIGFPVIRALNEIQLTKDKLYIPQKPTTYNLDNLAYDEFMPIVKVRFKEDLLRFNFDTGASATSLYSKFYKGYKAAIDSNYTKINFSSGGAGGDTSFEGYLLENIKLSIGNAEAVLNNIQLYPKTIGVTDKLHGNLGQDFIGQFDTMIISFKYSSLVFK